MWMSKKPWQLLKKRSQLNAQIQPLRTRDAAQKRKEDTRRKILLAEIELEVSKNYVK